MRPEPIIPTKKVPCEKCGCDVHIRANGRVYGDLPALCMKSGNPYCPYKENP